MKRVTVISRQADKPTLDIKLLAEEMSRRNIKHTVLAKKLNRSLTGAVTFGLHLIKQVYYILISDVIILDGYCIPASLLPKKKKQTIIQMWHALGAVKKFGWQSIDKRDGHSSRTANIMKMHRNYDYFMAPGSITAGYFAEAFDTPVEKAVYLGLPRIDFLNAEDSELRHRMENEYPCIKEKINVLYVPTFRKNQQLELAALIEAFDFSKFNFIIKTHPLDKGDYSWAVDRGAIVDSKYTSEEWLKISDKIVTDYSAMIFEAAVISKQIYVYQPDEADYSNNVGLNMDLSKEAIGEYIAFTEFDLINKLEEPYDIEKVKCFRNKYIEAELDDCAGRICDFIDYLQNR